MGASESTAKFGQAVAFLKQNDLSEESKLFTLLFSDSPLTPDEIYTHLLPEDIHYIREKREGNLHLLLRKAVELLESIIEAPNPRIYQRMTNAVYILSRLVPVLFENPEDEGFQEFLWAVPQEQSSDGPVLQCIAVRLIHALVRALFLPEFTVSAEQYALFTQNAKSKETENMASSVLIWNAGPGFTGITPPSKGAWDRNRRDVLRLLVACCSERLFLPSDVPCAQRFAAVLASADCPHVYTLFWSLLNTALVYDPIGWGIPYVSAVWKDELIFLSEISLHLLLLLVNFRPLEEEDSVNAFLMQLRSISQPGDMSLIFTNITRMLESVPGARSGMFPGATKEIGFQQELLIFSWLLMTENPTFYRHILQFEDITDFVCPLLFYMYDGRVQRSKTGLINLSTFLLLLLSGERSLGVQLNKPFDHKYKSGIPSFIGSTADWLVFVFHKLVSTGSAVGMDRLYNSLVTILANITSYCKHFSLPSVRKFLQLLEFFTTKNFLLAHPENYLIPALLLEAINNLIQYQYEGNLQLAYSIVRRREVFERIVGLSLIEKPSVDPKVEEKHDDEEEGEGESEAANTIKAPTVALEDGSEWTPTEEWLQEVKTKLPTDTCVRLIQALLPQFKELVARNGGHLDDDSVLQFLRATTLVGLLPQPHPIVIRKYQPNKDTMLWVSSFLWGVIFLRSSGAEEPPLYDSRTVRLFQLSSPAPPQEPPAPVAEGGEEEEEEKEKEVAESATGEVADAVKTEEEEEEEEGMDL